jgi:hypothetical protein
MWPVSTYYRGDQLAGITAPDLAQQCDFSEHIVRARGKRTPYTSVSLDRHAIERFGECDYLLLRDLIDRREHALVEHADLLRLLGEAARGRDKAEKLMAVRALDYARRRKEGLVVWKFDVASVERKNLISWAYQRVQEFFQKC